MPSYIQIEKIEVPMWLSPDEVKNHINLKLKDLQFDKHYNILDIDARSNPVIVRYTTEHFTDQE